jgi:hypothetical protein
MSGFKSLISISLFGGILLLVACTDKPAKTEDIRPVRVMVVAPSGAKKRTLLVPKISKCKSRGPVAFGFSEERRYHNEGGSENLEREK